jgi:hypothetical protein
MDFCCRFAFSINQNVLTIFGTDLSFFSIDMLKNDGTVPMISLFKQKRTKGWWPLYIKTDNDGLLLQVCIFIT